MKKEVKAVIAVVLAVWFFVMGFELGTYRERSRTKPAASTTVAPAQTSQTTTAAATEPVAQSESQTEADSGQDESSAPQSGQTTAAQDDETTKKADVSEMSKAQIIDAFSAALNGAKSEQNMTANRHEVVTIQVTDCSVPALTGTINTVINGLAGEERVSYSFQGGQAVGIDEDGSEADDGAVVTPMQAIPPKNVQFSVAESSVKQATAEQQGENTVYTLYLVEENTTFAEPVPPIHSNAFGYLDLTTIDIPVPGVSISDANMHYPETILTATVNADGKLVKINYFMPMDGNGTAKIPLASGSASFEGSDNETWEFSY